MTTTSSTIPAIEQALDYHGPLRFEEIGYGLEQAAERNRLRAYFAAVALKAYTDICTTDTADNAIADLIADMRHFAASGYIADYDDGVIGPDEFTDLQDRAERRWDEEVFGDE